MSLIRKQFVAQIRSIDEKTHTLEAVMSDETLDRYQEIILAEAYRKRLSVFKKHPVLLSSHRYGDLRNQIGEWTKVWIEGKQLIGKAKYYVNEGNPEADWAFKLATKGIAAFSVGFLPHGYEETPYDEWKESKGKKPRRTYTDVELLETSQVLIPANPSAVQRSAFDEDLQEYSLMIKNAFPEEEMDHFEEPDPKFLIGVKTIKTEETDGEEKTEREEETNKGDTQEEEVVTKPDTDKYYHIGVPGEEGKHKEHTMKTITVSSSKGIKAHYCVKCKKITGYLFDTSKWTKEDAVKWVEDHTKDYDEMVSEMVEAFAFVSEEVVTLETIPMAFPEDWKEVIAGVVEECLKNHFAAKEPEIVVPEKETESYLESVLEEKIAEEKDAFCEILKALGQ